MRMRLSGILQSIVAGLIGVVFATSDAGAAPPKKKRAENAEPAEVETPITVEPVAFGADQNAVVAAYEKLIEKDFAADFDKAEPGVELRRLEEKLQDEKSYLKKSLLLLDSPPTTLDGTPLVGEFSYGNQESILRIERGGKKRTLFFIRGKLWKMIDAYPLGATSKWGASFKTALAKLEERTEVPGRVLPANEAEGRRYEVAVWADQKTHMRAINWGKQLAVSYAERATEARLPELRTVKEKKVEALDPAVKAVLR